MRCCRGCTSWVIGSMILEFASAHAGSGRATNLCIAGQAAAWWLGLVPDPPATIMVIVPLAKRRDPQAGVHVVRATIDPRDADFEDWIKVTRVPRTCLDLARQDQPDRLETALRLRRTDIPRLEQSLERGRGRRGRSGPAGPSLMSSTIRGALANGSPTAA